MKVSVIMPVYNGEKYIKPAIESVLQQTYKDFELLCINDGSTDSSPQICEEFAKMDNRVRVYHQQNKGTCVTRNRGIGLASGEYIAFIDDDDIYDLNLLDIAMGAAKEERVDIIKFGYRQIQYLTNDTVQTTDHTYEKELEILLSDHKKMLPSLFHQGFFSTIWSGIYRKDFILDNKILFDPRFSMGYEDNAFNYMLYGKGEKYVISDKILYQYHQRFGISTSTHFSPSRMESFLLLAKYEKKLYDDLQIKSIYPNLWRQRVAYYAGSIAVVLASKHCKLSFHEKRNKIKLIRQKEPFLSFNKSILPFFPIKDWTKIFLFYKAPLLMIPVFRIVQIFKNVQYTNNRKN